MSKSTTIICDSCGCSVSAEGYAALWGRLRKKGWTSPERKKHLCKKCSMFDILQEKRDISAQPVEA